MSWALEGSFKNRLTLKPPSSFPGVYMPTCVDETLLAELNLLVSTGSFPTRV